MAGLSSVAEVEERRRRAGARAWRGGSASSGRTSARLSRLPILIARSLGRELEEGRGFHWLPVLAGIGVLIYFGLPLEPPLGPLAALWFGLVVGAIVARRTGYAAALIGLAAISGGLTLMKVRTDLLAAPTLPASDVLTVSGWVESRDPIGANGARLVVRVTAMEGLDAEALPYRIRVTAQSGAASLSVGDGVTMLASLRPPQGPVMPGGYSFGQADFYARVGASGFSYGAPREAEIGEAPLDLRLIRPLQELRRSIGERIVAALPGEAGQVARALVTGERGGISDDTEAALRQSGLAHIIAISGLHLALVYGTVFWLVRALFAASPSLALRRPIKKWSVTIALLVVAAYFVVSGASIATQRAFVMIAVMSGAVLFDQRAFSIRNIALAALVVLALTPEAVLAAGFQMSFAATLALIAGYEAIVDWQRRRPDLGERKRRSAIRTWVVGTVTTSLIAGLATVPFAAYHFQRTAPLALLANILAAPAISLLVMPFGLLAVLAMPLGLEAWPLAAMGWGIDLTTAVARMVAAWTGNAGAVPMAPPVALLLAAGGLLWLCLWRTSWRLLGLAPLIVAPVVALSVERPDIVVNAAGTAVAVRGEDGAYRILGGRGAAYEIETWLRADADPRTARDASLKDGVLCDPLGCTASLAGGAGRVALSLDPRGLEEDCRLAAVVVTTTNLAGSCDAEIVIDGKQLARFGAHAIYLNQARDEGGARIETAYPPARRAFMPPSGALQ